jgi:non-ribosomal peptide synthetase component F/acyl carrier protein
MKRRYDIDKDDRVLQFSSICFDASVEQIFISLFSGAVLILIHEDTLLNKDRFEKFMASRSITHMNAIPSFLNTMELKDGYSLKRIISGGDVCPVSLVKKLGRYCDFYNDYGPTETTVTCINVKVRFDDIDESLSCIPIGRPLDNTTVYVLDKWKKPVCIGAAGELYIGGQGVARGYLNRPELTAQEFQIPNKSLYYRSYKSYMSNIIYRTGDLARWLPEGIIEFLGRIDHQVKIRGFRIELEEIKKQLLKHEQIKECVVLAYQEKTGDKYLCGYIVPDPACPFDRASSISAQLKRFLSHSLPGYMIPAYFMELTQLPLTSLGKIDRKSLPEPENIRTGKEYTAPRNNSENKLVEIWEEELDTAPIGIHDDFFDVGGHSLKAIGVVNKIHKHFGVKISVRDLFRFSTISSMVPLIQRSEITGFQEIEKQPEKAYYELSYSQKRLWFIIKKEPHNTSFNMPGMIALHEAVDEVVLRGVLQQLIHRHEGLRTSFKEINREPVQVIEPAAGIKPAIQIIDLSGLEEAQRQDRLPRLLFAESSHIFDLKEAPLLRVKLVKCKTDQYYLVFNMHHIISDGWSIEILKREFNRYYQAAQKGFVIDMPPLEIQYKDYAAWQNQLLADEEKIKKAEEFWKNQLAGGLTVLNLPYDFTGQTASRESAAYRWVVTGELTSRLRQMGVDNRASLFMVLLAGFNILLSQVTGQEDIIMAIPAAARQHEALKNIIGMFINTLILQNTINDEESFAGFFKHFRDNTFKVLEYQGFPLELICGQLKIKYPTISVFFNMINIESTHREELTDFTCYHIEKVQEAKFDMVCYLIEYKNGIDISCHYLKDRFKPISIEKLMHLYTKVLEGISREPHREIWRIGAHSEAGTNRIVQRKIIKR